MVEQSFDDLLSEVTSERSKKIETAKASKLTFDDLLKQTTRERYDRESANVDSAYINKYLSDSSDFLKSSHEKLSNMSYASGTDVNEKERRRANATDLEYRANVINTYLDKNKDSIDEATYKSLVDALGSYKSSYADINTAFDDYSKYYSQWKDAEDYLWTSPDAAEDRKKRYEDNQKRIDEITYNGMLEDFFLTDKQKAEVEKLRAENQQYDLGGKVIDNYSNYTKQPDFDKIAANRGEIPTKEEIAKFDAMNDQTTWSYDANGVAHDAFGNELATDQYGNLYNPHAQQSPVSDRLGLYLSATDEEIKDYMSTLSSDVWAGVISDATDGSWGQLTEDEIKIYYYLRNTEGQEAADKYLADMKPELNRRETIANTEKWGKEYDNANILKKLKMNAETIPANLFSGVAGFIDNTAKAVSGNEINPYDLIHGGARYTDTVRAKTAEDLDKTNFKIPLVDFTLGDIYQTTMSRIDSALATTIAGPAGTALLGMQAAEREAYKLYQQGASDAQITAGALLAGAAEMVWEYVSFDQLEKMKSQDIATISKRVKSILAQGLGEAREESLTTVTNLITNALVMGTKSDLAEMYKENKDKAFGMFNDVVQEITHDALGGFIGGAGAGVGGVATNYIKNNADYKAAARYNEVQTRKAVQAKLEAMGETEGTQAVAEAITKKLNNQKLTMADEMLIDGSVYGNQLLKQIESGNAQPAPEATATTQEQQTAQPEAPVAQTTAAAQMTLADAVQAVDADLWNAISEDAQNADSAMIKAMDAVQEEIQQGNITPMQGAQLISDAYSYGGEYTVKTIFNSVTGDLKDSALKRAQKYSAEGSYATQNEMGAQQQAVETKQDSKLPETAVGAAKQGFDPLSDAMYKYGNIPEGENPARVVDLPKSMDGKTKVSKTAQTVAEARATTDEFADLLGRDVAKNGLSYIPITNNETTQNAVKYIKDVGWEAALEGWKQQVLAGKTGADVVATGAILLNNASNAGDRDTWREVLFHYQILGTNTAQGMQALRILKTLDPSDQLYMIEKAAEQLAKDLRLGDGITIDESLRQEYELVSKEPNAFARILNDVINSNAERAAKDAVNQGETKLLEESLSERIGRRVAEKLAARSRKQKLPFEEIIFRDVMRFANEKAAPGRENKQQKSVNLETLGNYYTYQSLFQDSWDAARAKVEAKLLELNDSDPVAQVLYSFLTDTSGIENADVMSYKDAFDPKSTLRKATKEAANKAGIKVSNKVVNEQTAKAQMQDVLVKNAQDKAKAAELIAKTAIDQLGLSGEAAELLAEDITKAFYADLAEQSAARLSKMFGEKKIGSKKSIVENLKEYFNIGAFSYPEYRQKAFDKVFGEDKNVDIPDKLLQELSMTSEEMQNEIIDKIIDNIAEQIPSTALDKWNALRYLNMLGNFKTQGRNLAANLGTKYLYDVKDGVVLVLENIAHAATGGKIEKTKALFVSKEQLAAAKADFEDVKFAVLGGQKYSDTTNQTSEFMQKIQDKRKIFKSENKVLNAAFAPLEGYRKLTNWAMEAGDIVFSKPAYARALAGYLKVHGFTGTDYSKADVELMENARLFAAKEAQERTLRDNNAIANWFSTLLRERTTPKAIKIASEGMAPFRKTVANALIRVEEFSPLGLINTTVEAFKAAKKDSGVTANNVINSFAKTFTGSALFGLGMLLFNSGMITTGEDDEEDEFQNMNGRQNYAFVLPDGTSFTIDFLTTEAIPLLMGAELQKLINEEGFNLKNLESALASITDPLIQMSMLQGVNDAIEGVKWDENKLAQIGVNACLSYLTQGLTNTLLGQIERSFEDSRMQTYIDPESDVPDWLQKAIGKASAKIPGWDNQQMPYINAWGEEEENGSVWENLAYNMFSPSYIDKLEKTPLNEELIRLSNAVDKSHYPSTPDKKLSYTNSKGEKVKDYTLSADEWSQMAKKQGQTQKELAEKVISSDMYKNLPDEYKAEAIEKVYTYAREMARLDVIKDYTISTTNSWTLAAQDDPVNAILLKAATDSIIDGLVPEDGYDKPRTVQKVEAITSADELLSQEEQADALRDLLTDGMAKRYDKVIDMGYSNDDFAKVYSIYTQVQDDKNYGKDDAIKEIMKEFGITKSQARKLYEAYTEKLEQ